MCVMRTSVREAYDAAGWPSSATDPVLALARRLRAGGVPVSTAEVIDGARALTQIEVSDRAQVRAALRVSLVKDPDHDDVFDLAFEALFPTPPPPGSAGGGGRPDGSAPAAAVIAPADEAELLAEALIAGDDSEVGRLLGDAVERWAGAEDGRTVEHHVQRVLRQVDLGRLYRRLLQPDPDADPLQRALRATETDQWVEEIRRRIEAMVAALLGERGGLPPRVPDTLADTPLLRAGPDDLVALRTAVRPLGVPPRVADQAVLEAYEAQAEFRGRLLEAGAAALATLGEHDELGIVLVGRPYNIYDAGVNMDIPAKLRRYYGVNIIPLDFLPLWGEDTHEVTPNMFWNYGRKILQAAKVVTKHPNLHIIYMTNFKCGPDSYVKHFIRAASPEPFLVLQFDEHTNDAGAMTRCEAYLDSKGFLRWWVREDKKLVSK